MGAVKICLHPRAEKPYYVEAAGVRLYSIEELAYYLYENIYLVDEQMLGEALYSWIEKELHLPKLAERLRTAKDSGTHIYNQVMHILYASEYYSEQELGELSEKIKEISGLQTQERMKYKADELLQNGNYWAAIMEYEKILSIRQSSRLDVGFYAKVWNNLGTGYGRLFLFQKAAGCFENAYQFQKLPEYKEKVYYAKKMSSYGGKNTEEISESEGANDILTKAENRFKQLEEETNRLFETADAEELFHKMEKRYRRNFCF